MRIASNLIPRPSFEFIDGRIVEPVSSCHICGRPGTWRAVEYGQFQVLGHVLCDDCARPDVFAPVPKAKVELTPKMQSCVDHMKNHNNKLVRYPGGYWASEKWHMWHGPSFGTPTVEALVRRGVATYTVWKEGRSGKFPIECILKGE